MKILEINLFKNCGTFYPYDAIDEVKYIYNIIVNINMIKVFLELY
jgi:hypothetical protein